MILLGCTTRIKSGAEGLSEVTSLLKNSAEELKNDTSSLNETLRKEKTLCVHNLRQYSSRYYLLRQQAGYYNVLRGMWMSA